jgi:hypothetical protein
MHIYYIYVAKKIPRKTKNIERLHISRFRRPKPNHSTSTALLLSSKFIFVDFIKKRDYLHFAALNRLSEPRSSKPFSPLPDRVLELRPNLAAAAIPSPKSGSGEDDAFDSDLRSARPRENRRCSR